MKGKILLPTDFQISSMKEAILIQKMSQSGIVMAIII